MKKIILKRLPLYSLALLGSLFSTLSLANSPWANEPVVNETAENETVDTPATQNIAEKEPEAAAPQTTPPSTQGDVLNVEQNTTNVSVRVIDFPRRGMTTDKVQNELGRPNEIVPAVGTPPISRWVYDDRTVYFEYAAVIHVVAK